MFAKVLVLCFLAVAAAFSSTGVQRTTRVQLSMKNVSLPHLFRNRASSP